MPTRLRGTVLSSSDLRSPVSGIHVEAYDPGTGFAQGDATTDANGNFTISGLEDRTWVPRRLSGSTSISIQLVKENWVEDEPHAQRTTLSAHGFAEIRGTLGADKGGTGIGSPASGAILIGGGAAATAMTVLAPGAAGGYLRSDGSSWARSALITGDITGAALTKTDDTNVTLTLGGSPTVALLAATSLTLGWTGTLAAARLNSSVVQGVTNDTNVTGSIAAQNLTLGWTGTLAAARLNANVVQAVTNDTNVTGSISTQTLTLGWTGQLGLTRGGTAASLTAVNGAVTYSTASALALTAAGSTGQLLRSAGAASPTWTTATFPATAGTGGNLLVSDGTNWASVTVSSDATLASSGALTLASTIVAGGPTGTVNLISVITYDAKGRLTAVSTANIAYLTHAECGGI